MIVASNFRRTIIEAMEKDPAYIAQQIKFLRKYKMLTQENLAEAAGLSTRTIEKIESGRHRPEEQTLRSLARALDIDITYFDKLTPEDEERQRSEMARAIRKMVVVPTVPIRTTADFMGAFRQRHALRFDTSVVQEDDPLEVAASMVDWMTDLNDAWDDCSMSQQIESARDFVKLCTQLEQHGYLCHMGNHVQMLREKGKPDLIWSIGLMSIQKKENGEDERYAIVNLEGRWEAVETDHQRELLAFLNSDQTNKGL